MTQLFISHSSQDNAFVRELRAALADHGQEGWIDSRELRGGDPLWSEIEKAIDAASAYAVVVSTDALQSRWVGKELRHALLVREQSGKDQFPVIPLSLNNTKLGVLEEFFGEEPVYIPVSSDAGGVEAAMNAILVAVGQRLPVDATPIRILLVTARPEDDACGYIDHRASALPLVEAMEALPGLVKIHVLDPPTLPALRDELDRARAERKPYHVVHFDGHGVYDRRVGLGGLCFEEPQDIGQLEKRRHATVFTDALGPLLRDHRIPLVFLEACQTAQAEKASESVASEFLKVGVASVVAMSHSVLVETARRFVDAFYRALAGGKRVGDAMLAGQRALKDDTFRGRIFGTGEFRLEDWFVPVLFQEKDDPQLFKMAPAKQTVDDFKTRLATRLGELPKEPETGFVRRSRELLALQRLLIETLEQQDRAGAVS